MAIKRKRERNLNTNTPLIFWVVVALFLASFLLAVYGLFKPSVREESGEKTQMVEKQEEQGSIGELFDEEFASERKMTEDEFSANDPFKELCVQNEGAGLTSVVGGTVCLR